MLGDLVVDVPGSFAIVIIEVSTLIGHVGVELAELGIRGGLGTTKLRSELVQARLEASHGLGIGSGDE